MMADDNFHEQLCGKLPGLLRFAMKLCRNQDSARDLVQAAALRALEGKESFEPGSNMGAWLTVILRNEFFNRARKKSREQEDPDGELAQGLLVDELDPSRHLEASDLLRKFGELPKIQRKVLLLRAAGLSYDEIAVQVGIPTGTAKSRVSRSRGTFERMCAA